MSKLYDFVNLHLFKNFKKMPKLDELWVLFCKSEHMNNITSIQDKEQNLDL